MTINKSTFRFFYSNNQYFVSFRLPIGRKPMCYMNIGTDNRPFNTIIDDIQLAFDILIDNYSGDMFLRDVNILYELPRFLGYRRATSSLT